MICRRLSERGYAHPAYVESLRHLGEPVRLDACGGWLLRRPIPEANLSDCIGPYPLFTCREWNRLSEDLATLRQSGAVSAVVVPDPFGEYSHSLLESVFDVVRSVKRRWIVHLDDGYEDRISEHHRRCALRGSAHITIERCADPARDGEEWSRCYERFAVRRGMSGAAVFSARSLIDQLSVPGLLMYRALSGDETVGFQLYMIDGACAYGHLTAYTGPARRSGVAYAFYWEIFRDLQALGIEWVDLGAGLADADGLARWKSGWTRDSCPSLLCGAILRPTEYDRLTRAAGGGGAGAYFPAYRAPAER